MIAIVGATGVLGRQLIVALHDEEHPLEETTLFASSKSQGEEVDCVSDSLNVEPTDFRGVKVALIAAPLSVARGLIDEARKAGARVVDFSGALRSDRSVPLIAPGVNAPPPDAALVTVAGAAGLSIATALAGLHAQHSIAWLDAVALYGAAHRGNAGIAALEKQTSGMLSGRPPDTSEPFAHTLAFNLIPQVGLFAKGHPQSSEELATALDVARVLEPKAPVVRATALHVPTFHGLTLCLHGQLETPADAARIGELLKAAAHVKVLDDPDEGIYPMPQLASADDAVHVGRVRALGNHFWAVAAVDNAAFVAHAGVRLALSML
jgi:aspartate-semialdehyde dehydrogenase